MAPMNSLDDDPAPRARLDDPADGDATPTFPAEGGLGLAARTAPLRA
jgi:hypothetical protein